MDDVEGSHATEGRPWSPIAFRGRLGRGAFALYVVAWHVVVGMGAGLVFLLVFAPWLSVGAPGANGAALGFVGLVFVVYVVGLASFAVRRLRDLGRSTAWLVLGFVPVVNVGLLGVLLVAPGAAAGEAGAASQQLPAGWTGRFAAVTSTLEADRAATEELQAAALEEGRRFAERSGRRPPNDAAG